jgi:hypothetical protein
MSGVVIVFGRALRPGIDTIGQLGAECADAALKAIVEHVADH